MRSDDDLTRATAADLAAAIASGDVSSVEVTQAHLDRMAAVEPAVHAFLHVDGERALAAAAAGRRARAPRARPSARSPACPSRSRTCSPTPARRPPAARGCSRAGSRRTTRPSPAGCSTPASSSSARPTSTSSPWAPRPRTPRTARRTTRGTWTGSPAVPAAARPPRWPRSRPRWPSAPTPAARSASRPRSPGPSGSSRRTAAPRATAWSRWPPASTSPARAPGPSSTRPCCTRSSPGTTRSTPTSIDAPVPDVVAAARSGDVRGLQDRRRPRARRRGLRARRRAAVPRGGRRCWPALGAEVVEVSCPHFAYALPAYYLILPSEASSNLAKFDGMRFGLRVGDDGSHSAEEVMGADPRGRLRRRGQAPHHPRHLRAVERLLRRLLRAGAEGPHARSPATSSAAFAQVDVLVSPSTPTTAFRLGEKVDDPLAMYLNDLCTIPSNLAGNASASFPVGLAPEDGLPGRAAGDGAAAGRRPALPGRRRAGAGARGALGRPAAGAGSRAPATSQEDE